MADRDSSAAREAGGPARRGRLWVGLLALAGIGLLGYRHWPDPSRAATPPSQAAPKPQTVRVAKAQRASDTLSLTQTGTAQALDRKSVV